MTLVIMAAGIGSRFGTGIKQLTKMSEHGEIIMDFSIYDAKKAGFRKVVFVIRKEIEKEFREVIGDRIANEIQVEYAYQELENLPSGFQIPSGRTKPWGTGQALLACRGIVREPFVVINADDYYGTEAFSGLYEFLRENENSEIRKSGSYLLAMAGFVLKNTLSPHGSVTRGVCVSDKSEMLKDIIETTGIHKEDGIVCCADEYVNSWITEEVMVSMNMWALYPEFIEYLHEDFGHFLSQLADSPLKKEYLLPNIIAELLHRQKAVVRVLETSDRWIGITYQEDTELAQGEFQQMIKAGKYPEYLWNRGFAQ